MILGALLVNGLVLMNSRGAFLAMAVGAACYLYFLFWTPFKQRALRSKVIAMGLAGMVALAVVVDDSAIERFSSIFDQAVPTEERETGATRLYFWRAAVDMSFDYPMGKGYRGFFFEGIDYMPGGIAGGGRRRAVHSTWLEVLTEAGYLGLFLFGMMLLASWRQLSAVKRTAVIQGHIQHYYLGCALQAALISFLVAMSFIDRMRAEVLYWLILFAACAHAVLVRRNAELESKQRPDAAARRTMIAED